ncbi:MAG TPA: hypothetical protein PLB99_14835 [Thermotogota bacterium]|nr:hypothetical protein [Thermotogota bacterium]
MSERFSDPDYKKVSRFYKKVNLSQLFGYLCTFEFEGEERTWLIGIITGEKV